MKIITIIGARPQFIKAAVVSKELKQNSNIEEIIVHTGQHFDENMSEIFFKEMGIPTPKYLFKINGLSHGAMTGQMMEKIEEVLKLESPDYVMVYGDTNSTLAGALAAVKLHIPIIHVESGLRSFNNRMPEEINRILTDRISGFLFCPTESAISNLIAEGIFSDTNRVVVNNGDVMQDASILFSEISSRKSNILETLKLINSNYSLVTIHRAENTDDINRLTSIIKALNFINRTHKIILPVHPRTKKIINNNNLSVEFEIIPPVGYLDMLELIKNSNCIFTDSGGLQKEAYFFNKYCITLRDETEWVELIQGGYNKLVGADENMIKRAFVEFNNELFIKQSELYGGGNASKIIRLTLENAILE